MTELVDAGLYTSLKTTLVPTNGAGNPTFTRATTKNVFDNEGKLIAVKSGAVTLGGARCIQNLQDYSEDFSNATWVKFGSTVSVNTTAAPDGNFTADKLVEDSSVSAAHYIKGSAGGYPPTNRITTFSVHVKASERYSGELYDLAGNFYSRFDLIAGTVTQITGTATITPLSGGWFRLSVTSASPIVTAFTPTLYLYNTSGNVVYTGDGASGFYVWGAMLEPESSASAYLATNVLSNPYHGGGADGVKYFDTDSSGVAIPDATMLGAHIDPESKTNNLLWCRDLTNAAWVKTNCTPLKNQTGIDGVANSCSLVEFNANGATVLQTIVSAAAAGCSGYWVKWHTAVGTVEFTRDNITWMDITSDLSSGEFYVAKIENTSVTNPVIGFRGMNGGKIIVDAGLNHAGTTLTLPILTTSAAVTRAADVLTYQTSSNFSDTAGTILATYKPTYDTYTDGSIVGSSTRGLYAGTSNSGVQALDGTNTINGPAGTPSGQIRIGARWSGSSLQCFALDSFGSSGSYDGSFNLSTIGILPGTAGYIRDLAIWTSSLTDNEIRDAWNLITTYITSGSLVGMQSILSSSTSSISTVIYGTITATYTVPTIEAKI